MISRLIAMNDYIPDAMSEITSKQIMRLNSGYPDVVPH